MEKHIDSYNREYKIKFANDHSLAMSELQKARTVYKEKIDQMQREMKRGPQSSQTYTQEQSETIEKLKKRIKEARDSSGGYNSRALYQT
jgi:predicted RNase H-like nuclease (RuvC/YqgF family)